MSIALVLAVVGVGFILGATMGMLALNRADGSWRRGPTRDLEPDARRLQELEQQLARATQRQLEIAALLERQLGDLGLRRDPG